MKFLRIVKNNKFLFFLFLMLVVPVFWLRPCYFGSASVQVVKTFSPFVAEKKKVKDLKEGDFIVCTTVNFIDTSFWVPQIVEKQKVYKVSKLEQMNLRFFKKVDFWEFGEDGERFFYLLASLLLLPAKDRRSFYSDLDYKKISDINRLKSLSHILLYSPVRCLFFKKLYERWVVMKNKKMNGEETNLYSIWVTDEFGEQRRVLSLYVSDKIADTNLFNSPSYTELFEIFSFLVLCNFSKGRRKKLIVSFATDELFPNIFLDTEDESRIDKVLESAYECHKKKGKSFTYKKKWWLEAIRRRFLLSMWI